MKKLIENTEHENLIVGLDIGTTKIVVVVAQANDQNQIEVLGFGRSNSTGVQYGNVYNLDRTVREIREAAEQAADDSGEGIEKVFVGIAGRHITNSKYTHYITRPKGKEETIKKEEVERLKNGIYNIAVDPGDEIITVIPQMYIIDDTRKTLEPEGEFGSVLGGAFQVVTGTAFEIEKILRAVRTSDLKVKKMILEPQASGLSTLSEHEKKIGVALVDIGGGTSDLAIYHNGNLCHTKVIPLGGQIITKDIEQTCGIITEHAEYLKQKYGTCIEEPQDKDKIITIPQVWGRPAKQINLYFLSQVIAARVKMILEEIRKEIESSGYSEKINCGIVLTGGGSTLRNIKELCEYHTHKQVRIASPEFGFAPNLRGELKNPMYATVLGLLRYGIDFSENNVEEEKEEDNHEDETSISKFFGTKFGGKNKKEPSNEKTKKPKEGGSNRIQAAIEDFMKNILSKTE